MASTGEAGRFSRRPELLLTAPIALAGVSAFVSLYRWTPKDWWVSEIAGRALLAGDLNVYGHWPIAQMGPLALLMSGALPRSAYIAVCLGLLATALWFAAGWVRPEGRDRVILAGTGMLLALPWSVNAVSGHADESLVLAAMCALPAGVRDRREVATVALLAVAVAGKPTALLLLPVALMVSRRTALASAAVMVAVYLPFFFADPGGLLGAGKGWNVVRGGSLYDLIGVELGSPYPAWVRPVQLVGGWLIIWWLTRHRGLGAALIAAWAFKGCLEPLSTGSYATPVMVAALLMIPARRGFTVAAVALVAFVVPWLAPDTQIVGVIRLGSLILAAALAAGSADLGHVHLGYVRGQARRSARLVEVEHLDVITRR